jgi:hypothetical protein
LVEQSIRNRQVIGSSPIVGSIVSVASLHTADDFPRFEFVLLLKQRARRVVGLALFSVASLHTAWDFRFLAIRFCTCCTPLGAWPASRRSGDPARLRRSFFTSH